MDLDPFALIRVDHPAYEPAEVLTDIGARLHALRGAGKLSLRPIAASFAGAPVATAIRVGLTGDAGETWLGVVMGADLTLESLRQALRATAPAPSGAQP